MKPFTCAFANLKPGTTKTTSALMLAAECHRLGMDTLLVDNDKAASAQRWADLAGGFPFPIVGMPTRQIARELPPMIRRLRPDALIIDTPQMEDHAPEARAALSCVLDWITPVVPAGLEMDRTKDVFDHFDEIDPQRERNRMVFFTRTNTRQPTKTGPDADWRKILSDPDADLGAWVFPDQVEHSDADYRQNYATLPDGERTAYNTLARFLSSDDRAQFLRDWESTWDGCGWVSNTSIFAADDNALYRMLTDAEWLKANGANATARSRAARLARQIEAEQLRRVIK